MGKADDIHRGLAKIVDFIVLGLLSRTDPFYGVLAGALYILIGDGLFTGQSLGKKLFKLKVLVSDEESKQRVCSFRDSIIRNLPFGLLAVLTAVPVLGVFFFFVGLLYVAAELYFIFIDERGIRIGDIYAQTQVVNEEK